MGKIHGSTVLLTLTLHVPKHILHCGTFGPSMSHHLFFHHIINQYSQWKMYLLSEFVRQPT